MVSLAGGWLCSPHPTRAQEVDLHPHCPMKSEIPADARGDASSGSPISPAADWKMARPEKSFTYSSVHSEDSGGFTAFG